MYIYKTTLILYSLVEEENPKWETTRLPTACIEPSLVAHQQALWCTCYILFELVA